MNRTLWAVAGALLVTAATANAGSKDRTLDIHFIDTEGGAATLIVTPRGESVLFEIEPSQKGPRAYKVRPA